VRFFAVFNTLDAIRREVFAAQTNVLLIQVSVAEHFA
jgi:BMFP domain-containing protein YqiC